MLWLLMFSWVANSQTYYPLFDSVYRQVPTEKHAVVYDSIIKVTVREKGYETAALMSIDFCMKYYKAGQYTKALGYAQEAVASLEAAGKKNPLFAKTMFQVGVLQNKAGYSARAIATLQEVINADIDPNRTARAHCQIGAIYYDLADYYQAARFYQKGLFLLGPDKVNSYIQGQSLNLCGVYTRIEDASYREAHLTLLKKIEKSHESLPLKPLRYNLLQNNFANYYTLPEVYDF
ncbi:MAG: hypothetical protein AAFO69_10930, partial [Bacteroidota bacterium]